MVKLAMLYFLIAPVMALRRYDIGAVPQANLMAGGEDKPRITKDVKDHTQSLLRKMSGPEKTAWIVFMGDSNMRHSYYWWVQEKLTGGGQRTDLGFSPKGWSDEEAIIEYPDGFEVRASFRFLHGSAHEWAFKTTNWHNMSRAENSLKKQSYPTKKFDTKIGDEDSVQPSVYAQWAAEHQQFVDFQKESPIMAGKLEKYKNVKPTAVVLTEGWGGMPQCDRFEQVMDLFKSNPEVHFVWSPIYVTNRQEKRHMCFSEKIAALPASHGDNFKFVEMWDEAQKLPFMKDDSVAHGGNNAHFVHIDMGGHYMKTALERFEDAMNSDNA